MNYPRARQVSALIGFIAAAFIAGAIGSWATFPNVRDWFPLLLKPAWNPPNWVFAPVWTTLYLLMSIAAWRAWRAATTPAAARITLVPAGTVIAGRLATLANIVNSAAMVGASVMLAILITLAHLSRSDLMNFPKASGEPPAA